MADASRDQNNVPTLLGVSNVDGVTPVKVYADPVTHRLLVDMGGGGGTGTVTSVSVVTANGFAGSVATATTTPAITLSTTVSGLLKGNGTAISAAVAGTDYQAPITLTTTGTSGAATFIANTLNIPQYQAAGTYVTSVTGTANRITSTGGTTPVLDIGTDVVTLTGTQTLTNKTLTSPRIGTAILDTNGNKLFNLTATASAVNELTYANAATSGAPAFSASGGDTNINIKLTPKGTGGALVGPQTAQMFNAKFEVSGDTQTGSTSLLSAGGAGASGDAGVLISSSRGTVASPTAIQNGDRIGGLYFGGYGTSFNFTAAISGFANETFSGTNKGTFLTFDTTPNGSTSRAEAVRITGDKNIKVGGTANRGTTEGTNELVLFNGTAPVGTLTNGVSFYAAAGEGRAMDAAGNSSLLTPHDEDGDWVFYSKNTVTGRVLKVKMERFMKFLNEHFEGDFVEDYIEDPEIDGRVEEIENQQLLQQEDI